jgi:ParB family chromosome partitioning protein
MTMAKATQKITLSSSRDIPFDKLVLSQSNVRRVQSGVSIEELAVSIARRGLIQGLHVRPILDADGADTGKFEVPAGGRRYRALELLIKQKRLAKNALVPCVVGDAASNILIDEVSLVENIDRAPLHPLDQFRTFKTMIDKGMTEEGVAAALFVDVHVVKQRLRLVSISPALLDIYAANEITLEQLMAFTVSDDHARQEQVWSSLRNSYQKEPYNIRRALTETAVSASDKRAVFVGVAAYEAAGGVILRDLFENDLGGWLQDVALLDRLVAEKLRSVADEIAEEGWKWVQAAVHLPYGLTNGLRRLTGIATLTEEERAKRDALREENDRLVEQYEHADDIPDEINNRLEEIDAALEAFEDRPVRYDPGEIAHAGVFVSVGGNGLLKVDRGYVRPEDEPSTEDDDSMTEIAESRTAEPRAPLVQRAVITIGGQAAQPEEEPEEDGIKPLPDRLVAELTAHRTLALRDAVANNPHVAMTALLHKLVSDSFEHRSATGALEAHVRQVMFPAQSEDLNDSQSAKSVADRHERWGDHIPADDEALWNWLTALEDDRRMELLAHCVSYGVNALHERPSPYSGLGVSDHALKVRLSQADRLARATGLDMAQAGWRPTVGNYFGRVTKARIVEAVREGAGERAAELIGHMKKGEMAKEAERLLQDTNWLPEPLRLADGEDVFETADREGGGEALPAFLAGDDDDEDGAADTEEDQERPMAAE